MCVLEESARGEVMKKQLSALLVSGVLGTAMLLGACAPSEDAFVPETPDAEAPAFSDAAATLSLTGAIDTASAANTISADLFGLFLEDINYASFALDDNLLINSSFENKQVSLANAQAHGWTVSGATMQVETAGGVLSDNAAFQNEDGSYVDQEHAHLTLSQAGATLSNSGHSYVPMAVEEGVGYTFSAFIKGYTGTITLEVTDGTAVYAAGEISPSGSDWVKYQTTLTATGSASSGLYFRMTFEGTGDAYLDNITLETQDANAATGIKSYLYEAIEQLSPKFFRFPGGCIIEGRKGDSSDEYYDWKNSIGAVAAEGGDTVPAFTYTLNADGEETEVTTYGEQAARSYNTDIWAGSAYGGTTYYQMEYAIGYYEYFLLCEELGAKAIPIVNCGLSCQSQDGGGQPLRGRHNNGIDDFMQDAFDLVAFAKGDPDSSDENEAYWAQVRVNMGHPEPFAMDYIGIGNEQWGNYYSKYYDKFVAAFHEAAKENDLYGSVRLIVGNCTMFEHCEDPDLDRTGKAQEAAQEFLNSRECPVDLTTIAEYGVVDQHYYVNFTDLFYNHDLYDSYARPADAPYTYYDVFVGEYAANSKVVRSPGGENVESNSTEFNRLNAETSIWLNALAEAAMMTGFERNGDIVKLAAYAPMFAPIETNRRQWQVDMMYYTNTALVRTPSYYVQQLFMHHSGDYKVASELTFASGSAPTLTFNSSNQSNASRTVNQLYYVVSRDAETGDIIIKIVNAGENSVRMNFSLAGLEGVRLADIAEVYEVRGLAYNSVNDLEDGQVVEDVYTVPVHTIGAFTDGTTFGYEVNELSVTAIRVRTR